MDRICLIGVGILAIVLVGVMGFWAGGAYYLANNASTYQSVNASAVESTNMPTVTAKPAPIQSQISGQTCTEVTQPSICPTATPTNAPTPTASACPTSTTPTATISPACQAVKTVTLSIPMAEFNKAPPLLEESILTVRGPCSALSIWAPLELPDGAIITQIGFYVADGVPGSDGEHSVSLNLFKTLSTDGSGSSWGTVHSVDSKGAYYNWMVIPNALPMNNTVDSYSLQITAPSLASPDQIIMINSVIVKYEIPVE